MDERTLTALKGSIAKWEGIVAGTIEDLGCDNCPLCLEFNEDYVDIEQTCGGCPVYRATGRTACQGTPYGDWSRARMLADNARSAVTPELKMAAQAEVDFLRSLLPVVDHQSDGETSAAVSERSERIVP